MKSRKTKNKRPARKKRSHSTSIEALLARGIEQLEKGALDEAAIVFDQVLHRDPHSARVYKMKGLLELQKGNAEHALEHFSRSLKLDETQPDAHLYRGQALRKLGRFKEAETAVLHALTRDDTFCAAYNTLGNVFRDTRRLKEAAESYQKALDLRANLFPAAANLAHTLKNLAGQEPQKVMAAYRLAIGLAIDQGIRGPDVANCHNSLANVLLAEGDMDAAIEHYNLAIELDPLFHEAYLNLGEAQAQKGDAESAMKNFHHVLEFRPDVGKAYKHLALLLRRLGRTEEAAEVYRAWSAMDPNDPIAAHMAHVGCEPPPRATAFYVRNEFDEFAASFEKTLHALQYQAPQLIKGALEHSGLTDRRGLFVLDAGCGTGLCAPFLRPIAKHLTGVDLSPKMLDLARSRSLYDTLIEGELITFGEEHPSAFDLIIAADVLIYFGALDMPLRAFQCALKPGGALVFTVEAEKESTRGYSINSGGRFAHDENYVRQEVSQAGLELREISAVQLRLELGEPVSGWLVFAEKINKFQ